MKLSIVARHRFCYDFLAVSKVNKSPALNCVKLFTMSEESQVLSPRASGKYIAKEAKHVTVIESAIPDLSKIIADRLKAGTLSISGFSQSELHPNVPDENALNWIFVVDTLNYCFWSSDSNKKWSVTWRGKSYTGYFALCAAINRAIDDGYSITDPNFYSAISMDDIKKIFKGDEGSTEIPLIDERQKCLHQVGHVLKHKFDNSFVNCIKASNQSAEKLLEIIVKNFDCYKDEGIYNSVKVSFYKRAQILIGDIWVCFGGKGLGTFTDIDKLTMFPDYRVPQVLIHFGTMKYSSELMELLKKGEVLKNGSQEEMEIRGCSIHVVELIMNHIRKLLPGVKSCIAIDGNETDSIICNSILIDHFLWDYRRQHADELEEIPFHKTLSVYY